MSATPRGPLVLIVIDGFGIAPAGPGNAVSLARTPVLDALAAEGSGTRIEASGLPVGLPAGQQGNSEVGHLNLGAGRRVPQMLVRVDEAIADRSILDLPAHALAARDRPRHAPCTWWAWRARAGCTPASGTRSR